MTFIVLYSWSIVAFWLIISKGAIDMKKFKRVVAVFVAAVMLVCSFSFIAANAADKTEKEEYIVRMTLGYRDGAKAFEGHAFLYFENLTDEEIMVGVYPVPAKGTVSIGTFGSMVDGAGLYYNVEAYRYTFLGLKDYISLTKQLTASDLAEVSDKITRSGFWSKFFNCTYFALTTWNTVPGQSMPWLIFPEICNIEIKSYKNHSGYFAMVKPPVEKVFKQEGEGAEAKLVAASWHMEGDTIQ